MELSSVSSCVRFFERMAERVKQMELEEARLSQEQMKNGVRKQQPTERIKQAFGHGVVPKTQWVDGELRITQDAMSLVVDYVTRKNAKEPIGRREWAQKAGLSEYTLGEYAKLYREGKIVLDSANNKWKPVPVQVLG